MLARITLVLFASLGAPYLSEATTLADVEQAVAEKWSNVTSFKADVTVNAKIFRLKFFSAKLKGKGHVEFVKTDEGQLYRMELATRVRLVGMRMDALTVFDGDHRYVELSTDGETEISKRLPESNNDDARPIINDPIGGAAIFERLREEGEVSYAGEKKLKGTPTWIIDVEIKARSTESHDPATDGRKRVYIAQETGLQLGTDLFNSKGKRVMEIRYRNIEMNPEIDPERFNYVPPPGATVKDETAE